MAKLVLSLDGNFVKEYDVDKETLTIGRKPDNDIHIDNLAVSGAHAKILTILNDSFIEDLGSTNGTFVDGKKIPANKLVLVKKGTSVQFGQIEMEFRLEE